jgi:hypothetical protein
MGMIDRLGRKQCVIVSSFLRIIEKTKNLMRRASLLVAVRDRLTVKPECSQLQYIDHEVHRTQVQNYVNRTKK